MGQSLSNWKKEIHKRDDFTCYYCGEKFNDFELHLDHIVPKSRGGRDRKENLITACIKCNLTKSDLSVQEFLLKTIEKREEYLLKVQYLSKIISVLTKRGI